MKKVLIIEDNENLLELIDYIITENGINIVFSYKPSAISEIQNLDLDLIILGDHIGDTFGHDLCAQIKSYEKAKHIPIVIVSTNDNLYFECGADVTLSGPFEITELENLMVDLLK